MLEMTPIRLFTAYFPETGQYQILQSNLIAKDWRIDQVILIFSYQYPHPKCALPLYSLYCFA